MDCCALLRLKVLFCGFLEILVMRDVTERPEAVNAGTVKLVGTDTDAIVRETALLLDNEAVYNTMSRAHNPYGDGKASTRIVREIRRVHGLDVYQHPK